MARDRVGEALPEILDALIQRAKDGDIAAIRMVMSPILGAKATEDLADHEEIRFSWAGGPPSPYDHPAD